MTKVKIFVANGNHRDNARTIENNINEFIGEGNIIKQISHNYYVFDTDTNKGLMTCCINYEKIETVS